MTPHPCEDCGASATSHRQIGGIRAWRCAACSARAEREAWHDDRPPVPDDLAAAGWFWSDDAQFLHWRDTTDPEACGVAVALCTFPLPGSHIQDRDDCFTVARNLDRMRLAGLADVAARRAGMKPPKKARQKARQAPPAQLEMELV